MTDTERLTGKSFSKLSRWWWIRDVVDWLFWPERCEGCNARVYGGNFHWTDDDVMLCDKCYLEAIDAAKGDNQP